MGQQQREGAEIVVSGRGKHPSSRDFLPLVSLQFQPGHFPVRLLMTLHEAERSSQVSDP